MGEYRQRVKVKASRKKNKGDQVRFILAPGLVQNISKAIFADDHVQEVDFCGNEMVSGSVGLDKDHCFTIYIQKEDIKKCPDMFIKDDCEAFDNYLNSFN